MKTFIKHEGRLSLAIPLLGTIGGERLKTYRKPKALVLVGMESDGRMKMSKAGREHAKSLEAREAEHEEALRRLAKREAREASEYDEPPEREKVEILREIEAVKRKKKESGP